MDLAVYFKRRIFYKLCDFHMLLIAPLSLYVLYLVQLVSELNLFCETCFWASVHRWPSDLLVQLTIIPSQTSREELTVPLSFRLVPAIRDVLWRKSFPK